MIGGRVSGGAAQVYAEPSARSGASKGAGGGDTMTRRRFALALVLTALARGRAAAQTFGSGRPEDRYFGVDVGLLDGGSSAEGYVTNRYDNYTLRAGLVLEPLDAAGRPLGVIRTDVRDIPARHRAYFRTRLPAPATSIRGHVESFEWAPRGGGA
jgi:hypothetical protein